MGTARSYDHPMETARSYDHPMETARSYDHPMETARSYDHPMETARSYDHPMKTARSYDHPMETARSYDHPMETARSYDHPMETARSYDHPMETGRSHTFQCVLEGEELVHEIFIVHNSLVVNLEEGQSISLTALTPLITALRGTKGVGCLQCVVRKTVTTPLYRQRHAIENKSKTLRSNGCVTSSGRLHAIMYTQIYGRLIDNHTNST